MSEEPEVLNIFTEDVRKTIAEIIAQNNRIISQNQVVLEALLFPPISHKMTSDYPFEERMLNVKPELR